MLRQATNVGFTATRPSRRSVALLVRAEAEGDAKPPPSPRPTPPRPGPRAGMREPAPPGTMRGPDGQLLKVVPIEKAGDEAWAGVAAMDDGQSEGTGLGIRKVAQLVAGDALVLLLFAVIGRINHGEVLSFETIATGYGKEAQNGTVPEAALTAVKGWALGIPLAVVFRSLAKGYIPDKSFIIVGLVVNFVFLVGWRSAYAALQKKVGWRSAYAALQKKEVPDKSFIPVGLVVNFVLLVGWRSAYATIQKKVVPNNFLILVSLVVNFVYLVGWRSAYAGSQKKEVPNKSLILVGLVVNFMFLVGWRSAYATFQKKEVPDKSFIIVGLLVNFVPLVGWRSACATIQKKEDATTPAGKMAQRKNKKGNPFEFFQLLKSLTTRW
eukprot:gene21046-27917_t